MPADIHFLRPLWFLALLPLPWLLWRLARAPGGAESWRGLVDEHLLAHLLADGGGSVRRLPLALLALAWLLAVTALAGPAWQRLPQPVFQAESKRVIVLDISAGMNAQDLPPSRLARARFEVLDLLARAAEGQTALVAYGAEPFIVSPLTRDAGTIAAQVPDLETDLMPVQGPKRADLALAQAGELLRRAGGLDGDVVLITDSLDRPEAARESASGLRAAGYRVSVLGVGTVSGAPVPLPEGGFLTGEKGGVLLARLRPEQLRALAAAGGGRYVELAADDSDTRALLPPLRGGLAGRGVEQQDVRAEQWREEGPWLLLAVLPLAALAFRRGWLSPLLLVLILPAPRVDAFGWEELWWRADQRGARSFSAGEHAEAAERFRRPDWRAAAQYRSGDFEGALETLEGLSGAEAAYNRGNALARTGKLADAVAQYERVLAQDPEHADARHNRDLLRRFMEQQRREGRQQEGQQGRSPEAEPAGPGQAGESGHEPGDRGQAGGGTRDGGENQGGSPRGEPQDRPGSGGDRDPRGGDGTGPAGGGEGRQRVRPSPGTPGGEGEGKPRAGSEAGDESGRPQQGAGGTDRAAGPGPEGSTSEPDLGDLLGGGSADGQPPAPPTGPVQGSREGSQAAEHMLRRVPDDPGGLLRQRFLLQHLRRSGRLP
jgi:Ca-activated chloride channel family protein